jgi:hypothetical protein
MELADGILHTLIALVGFWVAFMPEGPIFVKAQPTVAEAS